jgi:hypothetical protein
VKQAITMGEMRTSHDLTRKAEDFTVAARSNGLFGSVSD